MAEEQSLNLIDVNQDIFKESSEPPDEVKVDGINIWQTAISICGVSAGFGLLAVVYLVVATGWMGIVVFVGLFSMTMYTGILLGRCWNVVRSKWGTERHPYGAIGYEAFGKWTQSLINVLVAAASFISGTVVLLVFAETTVIIGGPALRGTFCYWPLIYFIILCPFVWLGTPKDFWWVLALSFCGVVLGILFLIMGIFTSGDYEASWRAVDEPLVESNFFHLVEMAGIMIWAMGIHSSMPTLQQDMKQPQNFTKAIIFADMCTLFMGVAVMLSIYIVHGGSLENVTGDGTAYVLLREGALKTASSTLILTHLAGAVLIMNNPLFQYLEELLDISEDFNLKRVALRTSVLVIQVFIQETIPHFSLVGAIAGGCVTPILVFALPCLCYLRLRKQLLQESRIIHLLETTVCYVIIGITPFIMGAILFVTITEMSHGQTVFTVPCYINATQAHV